MHRLTAAVVLLATIIFVPASAAPKAVTLAVPGMTCPLCPITIKKALSRVHGVDQVKVDFDKREATIVYDDAATDIDALRNATANAGYPSTVKR